MMSSHAHLLMPSKSSSSTPSVASLLGAATSGSLTSGSETALAGESAPDAFDQLLLDLPDAALTETAALLSGQTTALDMHAALQDLSEEPMDHDPLFAVLAQLPEAPVLSVSPEDMALAGSSGSPLPAATALDALAAGNASTLNTTAAPASANAEPAAAFAISQDTAETAAPIAANAMSAEKPALQLNAASLEHHATESTVLTAPPLTAAHTQTLVQTVTQASLAAANAPVMPQPDNTAAGYGDRFASHITWLAEQGIGRAEIRVSPEHLGTIDIRLQMNGSELRADFHSQQPEVRQALESSMPRLRDMLQQHGLQLTHAGVGQGQGQEQSQKQQGFSAATQGTAHDTDAANAENTPASAPAIPVTRGLVDVYA